MPAKSIIPCCQATAIPTDGIVPDPQGGYIVIINGRETLWPDDLEMAQRMYHDYVSEPAPRLIPWYYSGHCRHLEVTP